MYDLEVIKKTTRSIKIKISQKGKVIITVPRGYTDAHIQEILKKKEIRIQNKLGQISQAKSNLSLMENQILLLGWAYDVIENSELGKKVLVDHEHLCIYSGHDLHNPHNQEKWYKTYAKEFLRRKLDDVSATVEIPYKKLIIRDQKTRWGTCSSKGNIGLNWRLIKMPDSVLEYVICHELAHLKEMNHSVHFRSFLNEICPHVSEAKKWLKEKGMSLY